MSLALAFSAFSVESGQVLSLSYPYLCVFTPSGLGARMWVMKHVILSNGSKVVKRYHAGKCYACVWSSDTEERQMQRDMAMGDAAFFPYNETTGEFVWGVSQCGTPMRFRK